MSWLEKFTESDIKKCYQSLTKTQTIVLNEWSQITTNINELQKRLSEQTGKEFSIDTIRQHQTGIKNQFKDYIKTYLLTEEEKKALQELEEKPTRLNKDEKARLGTLMVNKPSDLLRLIYSFKPVFNALAEGRADEVGDDGDDPPLIEYELHTIINSKLTILEKIDFLSRIIEQNPEIVNETDEIGGTPLFAAVATNQLEIVEFLLDQEKISIDIPNYYGWTPFLKAANIGSLEIVKLLVESGTKTDAVTRMNANAVYEAAYGCDDINMVKYLVEKCELDMNISTIDQFTPLITAIWRRNYQIAQYLIQSDKLTSINAKDIKDENALYKAISQGYFDLAQSLHEKGAEFYRPRPLSSPAKISRVDSQMTTFFEAVERDDFETAEKLLEAVGDEKTREQMVNQVKKPYDRSLLSIAAENGNIGLVKLLVEKKADLFARNNHGRTPKEMVLTNIAPEVYAYLEAEEQKNNSNPREDELRHLYNKLTYDEAICLKNEVYRLLINRGEMYAGIGLSVTEDGGFKITAHLSNEPTPDLMNEIKKIVQTRDIKFQHEVTGLADAFCDPDSDSNQHFIEVGASISRSADNSPSGTLGCFVCRENDDSLMLLSCTHVIHNIDSPDTGLEMPNFILSPAFNNGGRSPQDAIAVLEDYDQRFIQAIHNQSTQQDVNLLTTDEDIIDAAVAKFNSVPFLQEVDRQAINRIHNEDHLTAVRNIDDLRVRVTDSDYQVFKIGSSTGLRQGYIIEPNFMRPIRYETKNNCYVHQFQNLIAIEGIGDQPFSSRGDSGSIIYDQEGYAVALLVGGTLTGGSNNKGLTYAIPLETVFRILNVCLPYKGNI